MSIVSASTTVKFHELPSGNVLHNYQPGTQIDGPIRSISWSKDGNWLALVPHSGLVEIVSVKKNLKLIHTVQCIEEPSCASFQHTTKKNIAIGTKSGQVLIYDIKARNVKKRFPRTTALVTNVEFTAKDGHVIAACDNGEAYLYSNVQNNLSGTFKIPRSQSISALRISPVKKNYVVAGSNEGVVAVWDIHGNKNKFFIGSHKAPVTAVAFSPLSADLLISTGLDRQFCFYDIGGNKCVASIFVENSMMSVDFSADGKFIAMASQKGNVFIYDAKNIKQPLHTFPGHNSAVRHLLFKKCDESETSFVFSEDPESVTNEDSNRNSESIGNDLMMCSGPKQTTDSVASSNAEDSFLAAINFNLTANSNRQESLIPNDLKKFQMHKFTPVQSKLIEENKILATSTPDLVQNNTLSPIASSKPQLPPEINNNLEELVKNEVLKSITDIKSNMKYYYMDILAHIRQANLDLIMVMVKESIKVENRFNSLQTGLAGEETQDQTSLLEENLVLKQRIALLEREISLLKNNDFI